MRIGTRSTRTARPRRAAPGLPIGRWSIRTAHCQGSPAQRYRSALQGQSASSRALRRAAVAAGVVQPRKLAATAHRWTRRGQSPASPARSTSRTAWTARSPSSRARARRTARSPTHSTRTTTASTTRPAGPMACSRTRPARAASTMRVAAGTSRSPPMVRRTTALTSAAAGQREDVDRAGAEGLRHLLPRRGRRHTGHVHRRHPRTVGLECGSQRLARLGRQ